MGEFLPFTRAGGHFVHLPVRLGPSVESRFLFDTGIGLTVVDRSLCERVGGQATGTTHVGRRMSGQEIPVPLARLPSLTVGPRTVTDGVVGLLDPGLLPKEWTSVGGILGPGFFGEFPFTLHGAFRGLTLEDAPPRPDGPDSVPLDVRRSGPEVSVFVDLDLPHGRTAHVEVDTGSDLLILDSRYLGDLGVRPGAPGVETREGSDETGQAYVRHRATVEGTVRLRGAPALAQTSPSVMFQPIIHDGLLGCDFLRAFDATFDLGRGRLGLRPTRPGTG